MVRNGPASFEWEDYEGWTAGTVRRAIQEIVKDAKGDAVDAVNTLVEHLRGQVAAAEATIEQVKLDRVDRMRRMQLLPDEATLQKIGRYEAHLNRQLFQTMHELEALQARRQGQAAPLARLDVHGIPQP